MNPCFIVDLTGDGWADIGFSNMGIDVAYNDRKVVSELHLCLLVALELRKVGHQIRQCDMLLISGAVSFSFLESIFRFSVH